MNEENVDGGYLVTQGVYVGAEDFNKGIVRQLMVGVPANLGRIMDSQKYRSSAAWPHSGEDWTTSQTRGQNINSWQPPEV